MIRLEKGDITKIEFDLVCWVLFDDRTKMAYQAAVDTLLDSGEKK